MPTIVDDLTPSPTQVVNSGADANRWNTLFGRFLNLMGPIGGTAAGLQMLYRGNSNPGGYRMYRGRDTAGANTIVQSGDLIGYIDALGYDGAAYQTVARIQMAVDGTPGAGDMPGRMEFHTTPDGSSGLSERWRIDNAGALRPATDIAVDLGLPAARVRDMYVEDLDASGNIRPAVDGAAGAGVEVGTSALRFKRINTANLWLPYAYAQGIKVADTGITSLAVVATGNGGAVFMPFFLTAPMLLQSVSIVCGDTASLRTCEFRLFADNGDATIDYVAGSAGTFSFTPTGSPAVRTATITTPGTYLPMGTYWLVIRNTSTAQTFGIRTAAAGNWGSTPPDTKTHTGIPALGTTIDVTGGAWTARSDLWCVRLDGRVMGMSAIL